MTVEDALKTLMDEESEKMIDEEKIVKMAIKSVIAKVLLAMFKIMYGD